MNRDEEIDLRGSEAYFNRIFWFVLISFSNSNMICLIPLRSKRGTYMSTQTTDSTSTLSASFSMLSISSGVISSKALSSMSISSSSLHM